MRDGFVVGVGNSVALWRRLSKESSNRKISGSWRLEEDLTKPVVAPRFECSQRQTRFKQWRLSHHFAGQIRGGTRHKADSVDVSN